MEPGSRRLSLKWKIGGTYTAVMLVLTVFAIAATYQLTKNMVRDQLDKRALAVATNLSDASAGHLVGRNLLALNALARKYTLLDGVAYAFVEDNKGEIVAHTLESFPPELKQAVPVGGQRGPLRRAVSLGGKTVYERDPQYSYSAGLHHRDYSPGRRAALLYSGPLDCSAHQRLNRGRGQGHQRRLGNVGQRKIRRITR